MNFQKFLKEVVEVMKEYLEEDQEVMIKEVRKNNNVILHGLVISSEKTNVVPTIYMESFYELYKSTASMKYITEKIWHIYQDNIPLKNMDMNFFKDFEKVKDRIIYRLINAENNSDLLKEIPHIPFWDLVICFSYTYQSEELGDGQILIRNEHIETWGVDQRQLMELADVNTKRLFPVTFYGVSEVLKQMNVDIDISNCGEDILYVLSNQQKIFGASVILYPETLSDVAEKLNSDLYLVPSSIHELLVLKKDSYQQLQIQGKELHKILYELNRIELAEEDVLSDHVFFYDHEKKQLTQIYQKNSKGENGSK